MKYIRINFNKLYESSSANDQQIINSAKALIKVFENYRFLYCSFFRDYYDRDGNYKAALCHDTLFNSGDCREITNLIFLSNYINCAKQNKAFKLK